MWLSLGVWVGRTAGGRMLATALRVLAAALLVVAVPVATSGAAVVLAWGAMAVGFGVVGRKLDLAIARIAAGVTWVASLLYLAYAVKNPALPPNEADVAFAVLGQPVLAWAALLFAQALVGLAVAWLLLPPITPDHAAEREGEAPLSATVSFASPDDQERAARLVGAASTALWSLAAVASLAAVPAALAALLLAWPLALLGRGRDRLRLSVLALGVVGFAALKWFGVDLLGDRLDANWSPARLGYAPLFNPLAAVGGALTGSAMAIYWLRRRQIDAWADRASGRADRARTLLYGAATALLLVGVGLCLEIDRIVEAARPAWTFMHPPGQTRQLAFTSLAATLSLAMLALTLRVSRRKGATRTAERRLTLLGLAPLGLAGKFVAIDLLLARLVGGTGGILPIVNGESLVALLVLGCLAAHAWALLDDRRLGDGQSLLGRVLQFAGLVVLLVVGGFEVWRTMDRLGVSPLARQVGVSVYWGLFAVASVVIGFALRRAGLRYFGLGLLALVLGKIVVIDLQTVGRGWRTLSFLGVGLLLLLTSVLYGLFAAKLGRKDPA